MITDAEKGSDEPNSETCVDDVNLLALEAKVYLHARDIGICKITSIELYLV